MQKRTIALLMSALFLCACSPSANTPTPTAPTTAATTTRPTVVVDTPASVTDISVDAAWEDDDKAVLTEYEDATKISLYDTDVHIEGEGASASGSIVTVSRAGTYVVSGVLKDGQLRVEADGVVNIVLNGASIHGETAVPFVAKNADKVILTLVDKTISDFSDSVSCVYEDDVEQEPSATLFSKCDLTINGDGILNVNAAFKDGIVSRDGLKIAGGTVNVTAADDAVMGRDYVLVGGGNLTLNAAGDGIKSTNDQDSSVGFVMIEDGTLAITSENDGIQAESSLTITGGSVTVTSGGGYQNGTTNRQDDFMRPHYGYNTQTTEDTTESAKALKAGVQLNISGGMASLDAADDAIHSNGNILVSGGNVNAMSGDDGAHADSELRIAGGILKINQSYEGIEAPLITVDDGEVSVTASDDGFNASSGTTSGNRNPMASDDSVFIINGGTVHVDAQGDGLDSNGSVVITGGNVYVNGPQNGGNGTLDFASSFDITGGTLVAIGSLGMAQTPTSNALNFIVWSGCSIAAGDKLTVTASDGTVIADITATRTAQWAYVSSPSLQEGETYTISDGNSTETVTISKDGNAIGGAYGGMGGYGGPMGGGYGGGYMGGDMQPPDGMGGGRPGRF